MKRRNVLAAGAAMLAALARAGAEARGMQTITLFLGGDVMSGRGVDQILRHPADPRLFEPVVRDARAYVDLAERANGPIPRPCDYAYPWGDALALCRAPAVDLRLVNLETAITADGRPWPKGINYRMHPANIDLLRVAGIDGCALANNHVLDWGEGGLRDTWATLEHAGIHFAGAGRDRAGAEAPARFDIAGKGSVLLFAFGHPSSGIPRDWAAGRNHPGVNLLDDLSERTVDDLAARLAAARQPGDIAVASIHWGPNWGYAVSREERGFAQNLIARAGFDLVHGHSSHHAKGIELFEDGAILYGCGDFLNDYEGIEGYQRFRDDLAIAWLATFNTSAPRPARLELVPFRRRRMRLERAPEDDVAWLAAMLDRESRPFGTRVEPAEGGRLRVRR